MSLLLRRAIFNAGGVPAFESFTAASSSVRYRGKDGAIIWTYTPQETPRGIACDDAGNLYIASRNASPSQPKIEKVNSNGSREWEYTNIPNTAKDVAVDTNGDVYAQINISTDSSDNTIRKLSGADGSLIWEADTSRGGSSSFVIVNQNGETLMGSGNRGYFYNANGVEQWFFDFGTGSSAAAFDQSGNMYVAAGWLYSIDSGGNQNWAYSVHTPYSVDYYPDGTVVMGTDTGELIYLDAATGSVISGPSQVPMASGRQSPAQFDKGKRLYLFDPGQLEYIKAEGDISGGVSVIWRQTTSEIDNNCIAVKPGKHGAGFWTI